MAKKSKKSIYDNGGPIAETRDLPLDLSGYSGLAGMTGNLLQSTNSPVGTIGGGTLGGAAAGMALGPIGAGVGALIGGIGGVLQNKQNKEQEEMQKKLVMQQNNLSSLQNFQNANKMYQNGGNLNQEQNITQYNGLPHELGGLSLGENTEVEDNETRGTMTTKDYIFSDSLRPDKKSKKTFADKSKDIEKKYKNYDNDKFAIEAKDADLAKLMYEQEALKKNKFEEEAKRMQMMYPEQLGIEEEPIDEDTMNSVEMKEGGKIFIKKSKRGTFTKAAKSRGMGVQEFARKVLANKGNYSPTMVKKANFAHNAASWNQYGGFMGQTQYLPLGGILEGGPGEDPINPNDNKYTVRSVDKLTPEQLLEHQNLIKYLHNQYPNQLTNETSTQYAFDYLRNPEVSKKLTDKNLRWDKKSNETLGYYYPSVENTPELMVDLPSGDRENVMQQRLKTKFPITTSQFAQNPEAFRSNMDLSEYNAYSRYITGKEYQPTQTNNQLTRDVVMRDAQNVIDNTNNQDVQFAFGGPINPESDPLKTNNPDSAFMANKYIYGLQQPYYNTIDNLNEFIKNHPNNVNYPKGLQGGKEYAKNNMVLSNDQVLQFAQLDELPEHVKGNLSLIDLKRITRR
jgi:hypothetical protein